MGSGSSSNSEKPPCNKKKSSPALRGGSCKVRAASARRCYRAGRITRNPFFNFLREYRQRNCGMSILEIARAGGAIWRKMDCKQREPYYKLAQSAPKMSRKKRRHRRDKRSRQDKSGCEKTHKKRKRSCK